MTLSEVDRAYNVRAGVGEELFQKLLARYRSESERATADLEGHRGIVYDEVSGERLDVFGGGPAFVFLHGGYWRALAKEDSAFMARMLAGRGIATVVPDYTLVPGATLEEIVRQCRAAVAWVHRSGAAYGLDPGKIVVGGSSAGGHLTAMTMIGGWQDGFGVPEDVVSAAMPFSGLFDLRPLIGSFANEWLGLDETRAAALSPALSPAPRPGLRPALRPPERKMPAVIAVAEHDGDGFLAQSRAFHAAWTGSDLLVVRKRNHYDVVLDLMDADTEVSRALLGLFRAP